MTWLKLPFKHSEDLEAKIRASSEARIARGQFSEQDLLNIKNRKIDLIPRELDISETSLEKLRTLCQLWEVDIRSHSITSHRPFIGPIIVRTKKILFPLIKFVMKDFIREQRDFNAHTISFLAELSNEFGKLKRFLPSNMADR